MDLNEAATLAITALGIGLGPQAIVWFGSAAAGLATADSDLDFLIVSPRTAGNRREILRNARHAIRDLPVPVDLLVYFPDELADRRQYPNSFVSEVLRTGRVVHGHL